VTSAFGRVGPIRCGWVVNLSALGPNALRMPMLHVGEAGGLGRRPGPATGAVRTAAPPRVRMGVMATVVNGLDELKSKVGEVLGTSETVTVSQDQVNRFADATGDHQWIHVDVERAKAGPFGGPIAHGYLTLSLAPMLMEQVLVLKGVSMGVNYGCNKVRFPSPVPVGSDVDMTAKLLTVEDIPGGAQYVVELSFQVKGAPKPSCVAECIYRAYQ
jgi:acyl dehydratase